MKFLVLPSVVVAATAVLLFELVVVVLTVVAQQLQGQRIFGIVRVAIFT